MSHAGVTLSAHKSSNDGHHILLPDNFYVAPSVSPEKDSFFDSFRQGLEQQLGIEVSAQQLREDCMCFARCGPPQWFIDGVANSLDADLSNNEEALALYAERITECSQLGFSHILCRILCLKYSVHLHIMEDCSLMASASDVDCLHWIVDGSGSRIIEGSDVAAVFESDDFIHLAKIGESQFQPILQREVMKCNLEGESEVPRFQDRGSYQSDYATIVSERLEAFIVEFVTEFKTRISKYRWELKPGTKTKKQGKVAEAVVQGSSVVSVIPVVGRGFQSAVGFIAKWIGRRWHRNKAKMILGVTDSFKGDKTDFRKLVAETGFTIFKSFENQFARLTDAECNWKRAMAKLAEDSVNRVMNHIKDQKAGTRMTLDVLTEGVVMGKSKEGLGASLLATAVQDFAGLAQGGHTLNQTGSGEQWKTSTMFGRTGLIIIEDGLEKYYKWAQDDGEGDSEMYGYRLPFDWELSKWRDNIERKYEVVAEMSLSQHSNYATLGMVREQVVKRVLDKMDRADPKMIMRGIENKMSKEFKRLNRKLDALDGDEQIWFEVGESVTTFTERPNELDRVVKEMDAEAMLVICGLNGIGKSELALRYARGRYTKRDCVIWINSATPECAKDAFKKLAAKVGLDLKDNDGCEKTVRSIIEEVYCHMARRSIDRKCLFVFDGAENFHAIQEFLPLGLPPGVRRPGVLITSNCSDWISDRVVIGKLELNEFTETEAVAFIKIALKLESEDKTMDADIVKLAEKLHRFPLVLKLATTNMMLNMNDGQRPELVIRNYMRRYEEFPNILMGAKLPPNARNKSVFTALDITLKRIEEHDEHGLLAIQMLRVISYIASSNIPEKMFLSLANDDSETLASATVLLKQYSIISLQNGKIGTHGLVQQLMRKKLEEEEDVNGLSLEESTLRIVLGLLESSSMEDRRNSDELTPHFVQAWKYACKYEQLVSRFVVDGAGCGSRARARCFHLISGSNSNEEVVRRILVATRKNDPDKIKTVVDDRDREGKTPLHHASQSGNAEVVRLLIEIGAGVQLRDRIHITPLHLAAKNGHLPVVKSLLVEGLAKINAKSSPKYAFSALHLAAQNGHSDVVRYLLESGAAVDSTTRYEFTPLHLASQSGKSACAKILLEFGAKIDATSRRESTPLHLATENGHLELVRNLLELGANVDAKTNFGFSPLHRAVQCSKLDCAEVLLDKGADVNAKTKFECTPLHFAAKEGLCEMMVDLLASGADVNSVDDRKFTPLHLASSSGDVRIVNRLLRNKSINVDAQTTKGKTALHLAARNSDLAVIKSLMERKCDPSIRNEEGLTASESATRHHNLEVAEYIFQLSREVNGSHF